MHRVEDVGRVQTCSHALRGNTYRHLVWVAGCFLERVGVCIPTCNVGTRASISIIHRIKIVGATLVVARHNTGEICFVDGWFKGYPQGAPLQVFKRFVNE